VTVETEADRQSLLRDFGTAVQLQRASVTYKTTTGIFDMNPQLFDNGSGAYITTNGLRLTVSATAASDVQQDDTAVVGGTAYQIIDIDDDATGMLGLTLQRFA
jgi:hypothetical protein